MSTSAPEFERRISAAAGAHSLHPVVLRFRRIWAMPSLDTLSVPEIAAWVKGYAMKSKCSIDPFARNCRIAHYRNDLSPTTAAEYHMDSRDFLKLMKAKGVRPDLAILDPPYSHHQIKVSYDEVGKARTPEDVARMGRWTEEKDLLCEMMPTGGIVLQLGWNSAGMGEKRRYELIDVLLVCHGTGHNDTICIAERKLPPERDLFAQNTQVSEPPPKTP